jgi:formylmethanofuran dehydrogenase subunit B
VSSQPSKQPNKSVTTVCCGCNLLCDDVTVEADAEKVSAGPQFCEQGKKWLSGEDRPSFLAAVDGKPSEFNRAVDTARTLLLQSRHPLIVGLDQLALSAQSKAIALANRLRASIDVNFSPISSFEFALQKVGRVTSTLGEVRDRSDVVIFWAADPMRSHPRLLERINAANKAVLFVGGVLEPQLPAACSVVRLPGNGLREDLLELMRAEFAGSIANVQTTAVDETTRDFLKFVGEAKHLAIFADPAQFPGYYSAFGLHHYIRARNDHARAVLLPLRTDRQALMAENSLTANFGFARAVDLSLGFPRCSWDEFAAHRLVANGNVDCVLWFCDQSAESVNETIKSAPKTNWIVLNANPAIKPVDARVEIAMKRLGLDESGDALRVDDVLLPVDEIRDSSSFSAGEFLKLLTPVARLSEA